MEGGQVRPEVVRQIDARRGHGAALPEPVRERLSTGLGDDLGDVRVHHDALADQLARSVQARAFTVGSDIFFRAGEYQPGSASPSNLLAHEMTHVVQQRGAPTAGPLAVTDPGGALEVQAQGMADRLT